ncbi:MAG: hypothetical protein JST30_07885 [Armatimonadetes bacterium]|nr:hypothetical protein [Armatimonadota bacterium]
MKQTKPFFARPLTWVALAALGIAGYVMTEPEQSKAPKTTSSRPKKKSTTAAKEEVFTKEDTTATFSPVKDQVKNSFRPIVAKSGRFGGADGMANVLPGDFTGGDGSWVYTGSVETDGVMMALIENRATGDAVYLKRGERWKSSYVVDITEDSVVMRGPSGEKALGLVDAPASIARTGGGGRASTPVAPMNVDVPRNFRGPIGNGGGNAMPNGLSVVPEAAPAGQVPQEIVFPGDNE